MGYLQDQLENNFSHLAQALDNSLEDSFGEKYSIHPNRLRRGKGSNPSYDGLFATTIAFTLGYGSHHGRGYIVNVDIRTLDFVTSEEREEIKNFAFEFINKNLCNFFPDRKLEIVKDGKLLKIVGDFSLNS